MPVVGVTVFGGVLAHGGDEDAVLDGYAAELEGLEEFGDREAGGLRVDCCSGGWGLEWGEVGDLLGTGVLASELLLCDDPYFMV